MEFICLAQLKQRRQAERGGDLGLNDERGEMNKGLKRKGGGVSEGR